MGTSGYNSPVIFQDIFRHLERKQSPPANATVIFQDISWSNCYWSCQGPLIPRWLVPWYQSPTQMLMRGLTTDALKREVDGLNAKATEYINNKHSILHYFAYLALVLVIIGI
eukprot:325145_1